MSTRPKSMAVSKIAMYAESPTTAINDKTENKAALRYGAKAHGKIGKAPDLKVFVVTGMVVLWLIFNGKTPW